MTVTFERSLARAPTIQAWGWYRQLVPNHPRQTSVFDFFHCGSFYAYLTRCILVVDITSDTIEGIWCMGWNAQPPKRWTFPRAGATSPVPMALFYGFIGVVVFSMSLLSVVLLIPSGFLFNIFWESGIVYPIYIMLSVYRMTDYVFEAKFIQIYFRFYYTCGVSHTIFASPNWRHVGTSTFL